MFAVYRLLALIAVVPALLWLRWRAPGPVEIRRRWRERLGRVKRSPHPPVWIHAASVGEVNAAWPLIRALLSERPDTDIVVSTFTATGNAHARRLMGDKVRHCLAPLDAVGAVGRWLDRIRPAAGIVVETEIWPELYAACRRRQTPLMLVNARLSTHALKRYRRYRRLLSGALQAIELAACQTQTDADRFVELGLSEARTQITGNLKFDMPMPERIGEQARELRTRWAGRRVWVAGSTRPGEEDIVIDAHRRLLDEFDDALLVLAPRHPERSDAIRRLLDEAGLEHAGIDAAPASDTPVVLVDRLGELLPCYAAGSVAFVGGSLVPVGGHNLLEPAAFGKVVISGPHLGQQAEPAAALDAAGARIEVEDAEQLAAAVGRLWREPESALATGRAALEVVEQGRGSTRRTLQLLSGRLREIAQSSN